MKIKLEFVFGFLGSGKSNFINSYLESGICEDEKILIILLEKGNTIIKEISNNKVIYIEDIKYLKEIIIRELGTSTFDRIIVEYNGTLSVDIISDICNDKSVKKYIEFYGGYFIGDAKDMIVYIKNIGEIIIPFIQGSKILIINNMELISKEKGDEIINLIKEINTNSPIITIPSISDMDTMIKNSKYFKRNLFFESLKSLFKVKLND
ncbi:hypothetical protein [Clostridium tertium]|uniref:CobW/HypB/UreG, nucleotide-binding domain n=1 Tax=Clostridium tertium TaxID=1559 RepID=A0A6N3EH26_9CLOT